MASQPEVQNSTIAITRTGDDPAGSQSLGAVTAIVTSCEEDGKGIGGLDDQTKDCRSKSSPRDVRATEHHYMNTHQLHKDKKPPDKLHATLMKSAFANIGKTDGSEIEVVKG